MIVTAETGEGVRAADTQLPLQALRHSRPFLALFAADIQSVIGDQIARVALSVLVFERTGSASATALTYAATFVPAIVGGLAFSGVGDRFSRGPMLAGIALVRAGLFAAMAIAGLGTGVIIALLVVAVMLGPVFGATEIAFLSSVLERRVFAASTGVRLTANQLSQVLGFAVGGAVVAAAGPRVALLVNAATFAIASGLVAFGTRGMRSLQGRSGDRESFGPWVAAQWFARHRQMLALLALSALDGLFIVPEGLAVPFGHDVGAGAAGAGLLLAALPLGSAVGAAVLVRFVPYSARPTLARWMAVACGIPLLATALDPPWAVAFGCWALTGALSAFQVVAITTVAHAAPEKLRARIIGVGGAFVTAAQGLGLVAFGSLAQRVAPGTSIALAGGVGSVLAGCLVLGPLAGWTAASEKS